ncbi:MAG: gliding motility protein GldM [Bacteroidetes bacterium]|nr:gliding motility protein GldM [Bacteroidota bacterium]
MAGYKETPRQKMIAMMYLVLTALLALNVSKQILDAFVIVNESIETTNENFSKKLDNTYSDFKAQYLINPNKVGPYWEKAQNAHNLSHKLTSYIDSIKYVLVFKTERLETMADAKVLKLQDAQRKDNYDITTNYFIAGSQDGSAGEAHILREKIENYKKDMLDLIDAKYRNSIKVGFDTKGPFYDYSGEKQNWEMHTFYHTILAADVTILNKLKADAYNLEFDVTNQLFAAVTAKDWKFDVIRAKVIPKSSYVFFGEDYQAEILVAAYDTKGNPDVRYVMGSDSLYEGNFRNATRILGSGGIVNLKLGSGNVEGLKKFAGIIKILSPLGDTMVYHFHDDFIVAKPGLTISPTKMNVFYIGVKNPVEISVPGGPEKILPNISVGSIHQEGTGWIVEGLPKSTKEAVISVNAVFSGKSKLMGQMKFRLKTIPDPIATIGGKNAGVIDKGLVVISPYIICSMPPEFDFDIRYVVTSFTFVTDVSGLIHDDKVKGNKLTDDIIKIIQNAKRNKRVWFEEITILGPDGSRNISGINLKLQ